MNNNFSNMTPFIGNNIIHNLDEQFYIENILKFNKGKKVEVFMSFANSENYKDRSFKGIIEAVGKDHLILSDPTNGNWYLLLLMFIDFIQFDECINTNETFCPNV